MADGIDAADADGVHDRADFDRTFREAVATASVFVAMPFGDKPDAWALAKAAAAAGPGGQISAPEPIRFDIVFAELVEAAFAGSECAPRRADHTTAPGSITLDLLQHLIDDDLVIVDISAGNPNVFYELGVRHTARKSGTILLIREGDEIPFDLRSMRIVQYPALADASAWRSEGNRVKVVAARAALRRQVFSALTQRDVDSLVHGSIRGLNLSRRSRPNETRRIILGDIMTMKGVAKQLGYVEGDLQSVDFADVWVNPENSRFEMARIHENSVSALIRYRGAELDDFGVVRRDHVANDLRTRAREQKSKTPGRIGAGVAEPGAAVLSTSGELAGPGHNVRCIVHVAAQIGVPGRGFRTVEAVGDCVQNALDEVDLWNRRRRRWLWPQKPLKSVLFPLFGTRNFNGSAEDVAERLFRSAEQYLRIWGDQIEIERIYFLAYDREDARLCARALRRVGVTPQEPQHASQSTPV